nr:LOW QUALITY PROTEIN: mucin-5AC-like [Labrus bergylta]
MTSQAGHSMSDGCVSEVVTGNTGLDFRYNSGSCRLQKFSDDSSILGCITDDEEEEYRGLIESFITWCNSNHLELNICKTKELVVDYRKEEEAPCPCHHAGCGDGEGGIIQEDRFIVIVDVEQCGSSSRDLLYNVTDGGGWCYAAYCNASYQIEKHTTQCPTTITTTPGTPMTTTIAPLEDCIYMNETKLHGECWSVDNCMKYTCHNGTIIKTPYTCPQVVQPICANGRSPIKSSDESGCCYRYDCECACSVWFKLHYNTFDGKDYTFHEYCDFYLVKEIIPKQNLTIIVDNQACDPADSMFCPQAVVVLFQSFKIVLTQSRYTREENASILPLEIPTSFTRTNMEITLNIPVSGLTVVYRIHSFSVYLHKTHFGGNTEGQCGTCDNSKANDCHSPNGMRGSCSGCAGHWVVPGTPCEIPTPPPFPTTTPTPETTTVITTQLPCKATICELLTSSLVPKYQLQHQDNHHKQQQQDLDNHQEQPEEELDHRQGVSLENIHRREVEGFEYQEVPEKCCRECVQKSCFLIAPDNTTHNTEKIKSCCVCVCLCRYSAADNAMMRQCECCQEARTSEARAELECADGTTIQHRFTKVESCLCNRAECEGGTTNVPARCRRRR